MMNFYKKTLLISFLIFISNLGFSQSNEIKIKFLGNCGLYMTDGKYNFYIDFPYKSGAHNYMDYDKSEIDNINKDNAIFIFTHRHADHYSEKLLKKLNGLKFDPWNIPELEKLGETVSNFNIKAFETEHKVYGIKVKHYSYLITWHGKKIFINGDATNVDTLASLKNIDIAFIPSWLLFDVNEKNIKLTEIGKLFEIYHVGKGDKITIDENNPYLKLLDKSKQGEIISVPF